MRLLEICNKLIDASSFEVNVKIRWLVVVAFDTTSRLEYILTDCIEVQKFMEKGKQPKTDRFYEGTTANTATSYDGRFDNIYC